MTEKIKSNRVSDTHTEKIMQTNFDAAYHILGMDYERCDNRELQLAGIDVIAKNNDKEYYVDEKCATDFWDRDLKTFVFELSFKICNSKTGEGRSKRVAGWFVSPDNKTDIYALGYVRADTKENLNKNRISRFEVLLIKKKFLIKYINNHIGDTERLKELQKEMAANVKAGTLLPYGEKERYKVKLEKGISLCWSPCLAESPFNLIIDKSLLKKLSFKTVSFSIN